MSASTEQSKRGVPAWCSAALVVCVFFGVMFWVIASVTGFFRLSPDTAALRTSFMKAVPGPWDTTIALRVGWFTTGLARVGARCLELPPEAQTALDSVRGGEVGVYRLTHPLSTLDRHAAVKAADLTMQSRGWERIVGVTEGRQMVAVYWPSGKVSPRNVRCCVLVFEGHNLIVSSVRGNLRPVMELAKKHLDFSQFKL